MNTIIAPIYLHEYIKLDLIKKNKKNYLLDYKFINLEMFISQFLDEDIDNIITIQHIFSKCDVSIFKNNLSQPAFTNSLFIFYKKLLLNQLDFANLDTSNSSNQELKKLLVSLKNTKIKENAYNYLYSRLSKLNFSDFYIYETDTSIDYKKILNIMYQNQAKQCKLPEINQITQVIRTNNFYDEIEYVAQDIVKNQYPLSDVNIIIGNIEYQNPLKQTFSTYNIDNGFTNFKVKNQANFRFALLAKLYLDQTVESYYKTIINNCFNFQSNSEFVFYIKNYLVNFKECLKEFDYFKNLKISMYNKELENLISIEEKANTCQKKTLANLNCLINSQSIKELLVNIFNILKDHCDIKEMKALKKHIENYYDDLNFDNLELFLFTLSDTTNISESFTNKVCVTTFDKAVAARKISYVIGCTQNNYPGFILNTGYFNQKYLDSLKYYSQQEQFEFYQKQINWIFKSGENIIFSAPTTSLNGKVIEIAYDIESLTTNINYVNIIANDYFINKNHQLDCKNAKKVFTKNNNIYGSISSYEKYFSCPYRYFLNYGLGLYPDNILEIKANTFGSMVHDIFKTLISLNPKNYANDLNYQKIINITNEYFKNLKILFRKDAIELDSIQIRLAMQLKQAFIFYDSLEKSTLYKPTLFESKIEKEILKKNEISLNIKGYIDRIDQYNTGFRIIDYKSSNSTTLSDRDFLRANKLQLATYALIYKDITNLVPYGIYYAYYKSPKVSHGAYNYTASGLKYIDEESLNNKFFSNFCLSGFTFYFDNNIDDCTHIKQIKNNKVGGGEYNFDNIEKILKSIYEYLLDNLVLGNIPLTPRENACDYCEYQSICNFDGKKIKYPEEFALKSSLKEKKEDE